MTFLLESGVLLMRCGVEEHDLLIAEHWFYRFASMPSHVQRGLDEQGLDLGPANDTEWPYAGAQARTGQTTGVLAKGGAGYGVRLALASENHWRSETPSIVALVQAGVCFQEGVHVFLGEQRELLVEGLDKESDA